MHVIVSVCIMVFKYEVELKGYVEINLQDLGPQISANKQAPNQVHANRSVATKSHPSSGNPRTKVQFPILL